MRIRNFLPKKIRHSLIRKRLKLRPHPPELTIIVADNKQDTEAALKILHDAYVAEGFMYPDPSGMRITPYKSNIFVAKWNQEVVGTLSLIVDSSIGFPSDKIFDVSRLRKKGLIGEPSGLAIRKDFRGKATILFALFKFLLKYSLKSGIDIWVISVNPRHADLYEAILCFKRFTKIIPSKYVAGAPAIGFFMDIRKWKSTLKTKSLLIYFSE